jgi:hypothetical protein
MYIYMEEFKKRVTKNDKKHKHKVYSQKHVRNLLKQKEASITKNKNGALHPSTHTLLTNGRIRV